jgi:putative sporulation protein YtaF
MHFIYVLLIALANNIDNIGVRIAYSIRGIKISVKTNLWISVITFVISTLSAYSGSFLTKFISKGTSSKISMFLLCTIGLWIIIEPYYNMKKPQINSEDNSLYDILRSPEKADKDNSKYIDFKEATVLGIALSINNIGGSLSAGMIGLNSFFIGFFSAVLSFVALWAGNYITVFFKKFEIGNKATITAGLVLIMIGIGQVLK